MEKVQKIASRIKSRLAQLKEYRKRKDSDNVEELAEKALKDNAGKDVDVSFNKQHYGWFVWNSDKKEHEQKDMNDFDKDDKIKNVREFVHGLDKIKLEDYK